MPLVAIVGASGGSLASSVSANVSALLAHAGNRVLLIDLDPLGRLALDFSRAPKTSSAAVTGSTIQEVRPKLDLLVTGADVTGSKLAAQVDHYRSDYDVVIIDGSGGAALSDAAMLTIADHIVVTARPDRSALEVVGSYVRDSAAPVLGVVICGVPVQPRGVLVRTRTNFTKALGPETSVFASTIRSATWVAWWSRDRGVVLNELVEQLDRDQLNEATVDTALGLANDYAQLVEELIVRLSAP